MKNDSTFKVWLGLGSGFRNTESPRKYRSSGSRNPKNFNTEIFNITESQNFQYYRIPKISIPKFGFLVLFSKYWKCRRVHCLDVTTQPNEPDQLWKKWNFLSFLRKIQISIDHSLCLNIICSHFISIKRGKIKVFSKFAKNPVHLSYKYFDLILLITKKPGHI